jgi:hypothetical protein
MLHGEAKKLSLDTKSWSISHFMRLPNLIMDKVWESD